MYFKQLEIVGFKSFPIKTKFKFEPGVTAIVGPNGCGKSNISDAIRWVLGEQSAKSLRGYSMEDVIFSGTDSVEPTNMAEVSLTLSNEKKTLPIDYDEVTITRRLFRSGESEYILNKTPVRLKDITNLLMGTGLGTSSYSVIEQGKIDLILSSKPEDRRFVFEEASGITRYKSKKKEALRKLEHTENNLVRISDIINEVKRQINSIERHAKKAERYKSDFEVMKDLDLKFSAYQLRSINAELALNEERLEAVCEDEKSLKAEHDESLTLINGYREELDAVIQELTDTQQNLSETTLFVEKGTHKIALNGERVNDLRNLKESLAGEIRNLGEKIRIQEEEIEKIKERLDSLSKAHMEKADALGQSDEAVRNLSREIDGHQKNIRNAKTRTVDFLAFQTNTKNDLIKLGADLGNRKARLRRLQTEKENVGEEKKDVESRLGEANKDLDVCREKVAKSAGMLTGFKETLASGEYSLEEIKKRITESKNTLNALKSKEEILKEMIEKFEGFENGVRVIAEAAKSGALRGVIGIVADMMDPEGGYERALEAALGEKAQAVVAERRGVFRDALAHLAGKGSARFIIYEDIKNAEDKNRIRKFMRKEGLSRLSSFVKVEPPYETLADYLLGNIYVVEDAEMAYAMLDKYKAGAGFVTTDGFFVRKGYIFGGFTKSEATISIIGRAKKVEEICKERSRLAERIEVLREQRSGEKENVERLKLEIASAENKLKKEEIELANALSKKESVEINLKKIDDESSIVGLEIDEVEELINEISLKGASLNVRLNENESEFAKVQEIISSSQEAIQARTKSKNELIFGMSELKSEIAFLKNSETQESRNLDKETALLGELKEEYESKEKHSGETEEKIAALLDESMSLEKEIALEKEEKNRLKEKLGGLTEKKTSVSASLRDKEKFARGKGEIIENLRNKIRNHEIRSREKELKVVNITDRIREAYKTDIAEVNIEIPKDANWEEIKNQIEVLRIKLEKLGPVNLVAIEEHKELEERHSFLTEQREDLLMAKESLHKAIVRINKTTKALFLEVFGKIQVEFKNYFRMLFGGGHAELLLLDEGDVLESGIEIVARPPGKKLQNLLLLSGGEKALTAIALLFAIFKVKPSPFCILDEVDAPLDESNIGRFTRILQEFLKMSQFIVITHSKRTMQMADILYGITMEKKGISKMVSVKFAEGPRKEKPPKKEEVLV
ncbi:MAG: chromosome segregation protein SMC [Candidatus Omnitrophota bacterium]